MPEIRKCTGDDLDILLELARTTYEVAFTGLCGKEDMRAYLEASFSREQLLKELENEESNFYLLFEEQRLAGYMKLNAGTAQTDLHDPDALELERIYVLDDFQGQGLGGCLLDRALDLARESGKAYLWLGVWELNEKARAFYASQDFYAIGNHAFIMGDDIQNDLILRKDL